MIKIANRFCPFSHLPGAKAVIPYTDIIVEAFPTRLKFYKEELIFTIDLLITGPVKEFTLLQDLEKGSIRIWGKPREGYFVFEISREGIELIRGKGLKIISDGEEKELRKNERRPLFKEVFSVLDKTERLSLGVDRKLDIDLVLRRFDLAELLPLLFFLSQKVKKSPTDRKNLATKEEFVDFLRVSFSSLLAPEREDKNYLGLSFEGLSDRESRMSLFSLAYASIKRLIVEENERLVYLLPHLFSEFHAGRLLGGIVSFGTVDLEWAKRKLKKAIFTANRDAIFTLNVPGKMKTFRLKRHIKERGRIFPISHSFEIKKGERYFLDKFES